MTLQYKDERTEQDTQEPASLLDHFLEETRVRITEGPSGILRLTLEGDRSFLRVKVFRAFPTSEPDRYIGFFSDNDKEVGVIREPGKLDGTSKSLLFRALRGRYLAPKIEAVRSAGERYGVSTWRVNTDRGERIFYVVDHSQNIKHIGGGRVSIQDVDGNRFDVQDYGELDRKAADFVDQLI